ncbi:MAG: phosphoribosyltransferase family protein [Planctomycetota bacterium]|nr:phosphoribosyltransferase family protein [Planctomycetota bacterium]
MTRLEDWEQRTLLDEAAISRGLDALAARLRPRLAGRSVTAVPVLGGAVVFAADLLRRLPPDTALDFIRIQTYGDGTRPGKAAAADWLPRAELVRGRTILLLDDILDTGRTLAEARRVLLEDFGAAEVLIVVFVDKAVRRAVAIESDDCVLRLEDDLFLVGYGLDWAGAWRGLPDLVALELDAEGRPIPRAAPLRKA